MWRAGAATDVLRTSLDSYLPIPPQAIDRLESVAPNNVPDIISLFPATLYFFFLFFFCFAVVFVLENVNITRAHKNPVR